MTEKLKMSKETFERRLALYCGMSLAAVAAASPAQASVVSIDLTQGTPVTTTSSNDVYFDPYLLLTNPSGSFATSPIGTGYSLTTTYSGASGGGGNTPAPYKTRFLAIGSIDNFGLFGGSIQNLTSSEFGSTLVNHIDSFANNFSTLAYKGQMAGLFQPTSGPDTGYVALQMPVGGNNYYGWANITVNTDYTVTLNSFAIDSTPGEAIPDPGGPFTYSSSATPEPATSSLLLIALGAAGIAAYKRKRKAAQPAAA